MLLPFQFVVLTRDDAMVLLSFIRRKLKIKISALNYEKLRDEGIADIYHSLEELIAAADHYQANLRNFDPDMCVRYRGNK